MNLGILLWNTCNAKCRHCAVNSSPTEVGYMTDEQIFSLIDATFQDSPKPKIGLSGGEAFLYFERLCKIIRYATEKGALVSVNTNGYWGTSLDKAIEKVQIVKSIGLKRLVVSVDDFHEEYIPREHVLNVIRACKKVHLEVELQYVSTKNSRRLADFLKEHGDVLLNVSCREIPCHPVGRASTSVKESDLFLQNTIPDGLCPSAILSVSAYGKVIPCCNTAGHLPSLQIGTIDSPLPELYQKFRNDPLMHVLLIKGPKALWEAAVKAGYLPRTDGYVDQCHLCYDLFRDSKIATVLKAAAAEMAQEEMYEHFLEQYKQQLKRLQRNK